MKILLVFGALWLAASPQPHDHPEPGQPDKEKIVFTRGDPALRLVESDETGINSHTAIWKGRLVLTGKLVIEFDREPDSAEQTDPEGTAYFEPDAQSRAKLPVATSFYPAPATSLWLHHTPRELLQPRIGKQAFRTISAGKHPRYEYPAKVEIKSYATSVECDQRSYSIEIVKMDLLRREWASSTTTRDVMC